MMKNNFRNISSISQGKTYPNSYLEERRPTPGHIRVKCHKEDGRANTLKTPRGNTGLWAGRHETRPPNPEDNSV